MKKLISSDEIERLEQLNLQLKRIEGALKMQAVLFEDSDIFSRVSPGEVSTALYSIYDQVHKLNADLDRMIDGFFEGEIMNEQRINEIVNLMRGQIHKDDTNDIRTSEAAYFRNQVFKGIEAGDRDAIINVIWDSYLFGVYRGQHRVDQEG